MSKPQAQKVNHRETKKLDNPTENFIRHLATYGRESLLLKIVKGTRLKPCGMECTEFGLVIAESNNHSSFENFHELMGDTVFVLTAARLTPNPAECENYFYQYVDSHIKKRADFRLKFLKEIYLNDNIYKLEHIDYVVELCDLKKENEIILHDKEFKALIIKRLNDICFEEEREEYHCSGEDKKELHNYKVKANDVKIYCENLRNGLMEIIKSFKCKTDEEEHTEQEAERKKSEEQPVTTDKARDDFYTYLVQQSLHKPTI